MTAVEGTRLKVEGLNTELEHIYIIADTTKTEGYQLSPVADYMVVLALSQSRSMKFGVILKDLAWSDAGA
jgi:hypothetical protein